jgi:flagellar motor component MotA
MAPIAEQQPGRFKSRGAGKKYLLIPVWILVLAIIALGVAKSGKPANLLNPAGFLFVLVCGIALMLISFPVAEIRRAARDALASDGNETDIRSSAYFWETAGRSFWVVGILRSILQLIMFFVSFKEVNFVKPPLLAKGLAQYLLPILYGILLSVICFVPYWKLKGKLSGGPLPQTAEPTPMPIARTGWRLGAVVGYVLFLSFWVWYFPLHSVGILIAIMPAVLLVLGGTIAIMLFMRGANSGPTLSMAFAATGLIGALLGVIQMLFGVTMGAPGVNQVAMALAFFIASCFTALLGMILLGAPLEDSAVRTGRIAGPSAFSRVAWYVFPLMVWIFLMQAIDQMLRYIITPAP